MGKSVRDVVLEHPLGPRFERPACEVDAALPGAPTPLARLLLQQFVRDRPYKFFSRDAFSGASDILGQLTPAHVASLPQATFDEVTEALRFLRQANTTAEDAGRTFDSHEQLRAHRLHVDVFAMYSRLAEHVLGPLLALLVQADALLTRRSCTVPHQLKSRWEMAKAKRSPLHSGLTESYNPTIRNAIVHGGATLGEYRVTFRDDNGAVEELSYSDAEQLGERLLDTCNGVSAALAVALARGAPITDRLEAWSATERAVSWSRTPFLRPDASYVSDHGAGTQAELHGRHYHWRWDHLLFDVARAFIAMRMAFSKPDRYFLSFRSPEGAPSFFSVLAKDIPEGDAPIEAFGKFVDGLASGGQGALWIEHHRFLPQLLAKTALGTWLNWVDVLDRGLGRSTLSCESSATSAVVGARGSRPMSSRRRGKKTLTTTQNRRGNTCRPSSTKHSIAG
jgi:hypothetical protein